RMSRLTDASRRVAMVLLEEGPHVGFLTASDIGRRAQTSDATVVRTAQRLGYRGLDELKADLADELRTPTPGERLDHTLTASGDRRADPIHDFLARRTTDLDRLVTSDLITAFGTAVDLLAEAPRVFVSGIGPTAPIAQYAAALLVRTGLDARALMRSGVGAADDIVSIGGGDTVVMLAYTRPASHVVPMLERMSELGGAVVLITDVIAAPRARSVVLRVGRGEPSGAASHVNTVATIEALALAVARRHHDRARQTLDAITSLRRVITESTTPGRI
ncbi:MAG: MurR/RpiR family transcriptional regulator, partial [Acidimicrobiales bacterium]